MNAVLIFEDAKSYADRFQDELLKPALRIAGKESRTNVRFVPYYRHPKIRSPRVETDVANEADSWLAGLSALSRLVFLVDLNPVIGEVDLGYGLRVINSLCSSQASPYLGMDLPTFLSRQDYLVSICSLHKDRLVESINSDPDWAHLRNLKIIEPAKKMDFGSPEELDKKLAADVARAKLELALPGPRIVVSERDKHSNWLCRLATEWLV